MVLMICSAAIGGTLWLRASLASAFARGEAHGRAIVEAQLVAATAERLAALETARRGADRDAAALEVERDQLRDRLDDLEKTLGASAGGGDYRDMPCLDAGVVRALDAIRSQSVSPGAP